MIRNKFDFAAIITKDSYSCDDGKDRAYIKFEGQPLPLENCLHRITGIFQQFNLTGHIHMILTINKEVYEQQLMAKYIDYRGERYQDISLQSEIHPQRPLTKLIWSSDHQKVIVHQQLPLIDQAFKVGLGLSKSILPLEKTVT